MESRNANSSRIGCRSKLSRPVTVSYTHLVFQIFHLFAFSLALFVGQCGVRHGFVDAHHLFVQTVDLGSDFLVGIIVGSTGCLLYTSDPEEIKKLMEAVANQGKKK